MDRKIKLSIIGNIFGSDGYSSHTRSLFNALYKQSEFDVKLQTQLYQDWMKNVNDQELDAITKPERKEDWNIIISMPQMWKMFLGQGKNACYLVWEGSNVPLSFIEEIFNPKVDLVFVPSLHTSQAIWNTFGEYISKFHPADNMKYSDILYQKLRIIPHGVDTKVFYKTPTQKQDDTFKFLCTKGWRGTSWDRGGIQYLLKAFAEEFKRDEKAELVIKLNPAYINPDIIKQSIEALNLPEDRAPIQVICDNMSPKQLCDLYNQADCFICATRAESFNLPGIEAMSCGLPTIMTSYGGQIDYMTDKNSLFIDYELAPSEEIPAYEGINWAIPKIESIRKQLRWAFEHPEDIKQMGKQAEEDAKKWTWEESAKKIINCLN